MTKVLQINLGRGKNAHALAYELAENLQIDVMVVPEPNKNIANRQGWIIDRAGNVAIYFKNKDIRMKKIIKRDGFVAAVMEDFSICGCYISPNCSMREFTDVLANIGQEKASMGTNLVVLGDFNAKAHEWGSPVIDARGEVLVEWMASLDLIAVNAGNAPTFVRKNSKSFINITMVTDSFSNSINDWKVLDRETLSYHQYITFNIQGNTRNRRIQMKSEIKLNNDMYREKINELNRTIAGHARAEEIYRKLLKILEESKIRRPTGVASRRPYWWDEEVEDHKRNCNMARRRHTRVNKQRNVENIAKEQAWNEYTEKRRLLNKKMKENKRKKWKEICAELDVNIWGTGYQIVMRQFKNESPPFRLTDDKENEIIRGLFPEGQNNWIRGTPAENVPQFTIEELSQACKKLKTGTAPGLDGFTVEAAKIAANTAPECILAAMNDLLKRQQVPKEWKRARLILIHKPGKQMDSPSDFRPLCLINVMGKVYEQLIKGRIDKEMTERGELSNMQFGFRKGRSTVAAVEKVLQIAKRRMPNGDYGKWCLMVALDVRNAFNSASWGKIIEKLEEKHISKYIINIIKNYFTGREIVTPAGLTIETSAGIPQGSVLGPTLWNIMYDGVLAVAEDEPGVELVAFADDLAVQVSETNKERLIEKANATLGKIDAWMTSHNLRLAPEKTEAILLRSMGRRKEDITIRVRNNDIRHAKSIKYLGVVLDDNLNFAGHVRMINEKASKRALSLMKLLPNVGGPRWAKRLMLSGVVQSIVLYAAPVWKGVLNMNKYKNILVGCQRKMLIRVCRAYRTTSTEAIQVLAAGVPIDILVEERAYLHEQGGGENPQIRKMARQESINKWQNRWQSNTTRAQWTKELIPNIVEWMSCKHKRTDYFVTQALTGHGSFRSYTKKIGKTADDNCIYCGEVDDARHTLLVCHRWHRPREEAARKLEVASIDANLIREMMTDKRKWEEGYRMLTHIMSNKEKEEREHQQRQQQQQCDDN